MTDSRFIDSSIWIDYLLYGNHKDLILSERILLSSVLSLIEVKKRLLRLGFGEHIAKQSIAFIKQRSIIVPIDQEIVDKTIEAIDEKSLSMVDALIYASALNSKSPLVSMDNDFRGLKNVEIR